MSPTMHIRDIFDRDTATFSFEFFPPKTEPSWENLFNRITDFEALGPSFVSVTYGAGGSTRERTHELVERLLTSTPLDPVPHLTCVCHTRGEVEQILSRYAQAGVSNIMALRGDFPRDDTGYNWYNCGKMHIRKKTKNYQTNPQAHSEKIPEEFSKVLTMNRVKKISGGRCLKSIWVRLGSFGFVLPLFGVYLGSFWVRLGSFGFVLRAAGPIKTEIFVWTNQDDGL